MIRQHYKTDDCLEDNPTHSLTQLYYYPILRVKRNLETLLFQRAFYH